MIFGGGRGVYLGKRYYIAITVSISCLLVCACLDVTFYIKSKRYESYLNETMSRNVKSMIGSIVNAEVVLNYIVDSRTITREQADELYFQYHEFAYSLQELEELYVKVRDEHRVFNPANQYHFELYQFFEHLRTEMDSNIQNVKKLNDDELAYYNKMFNITRSYSDILQKYRSSKLLIQEDEWTNILKKISNVDYEETIKNNNSISA